MTAGDGWPEVVARPRVQAGLDLLLLELHDRVRLEDAAQQAPVAAKPALHRRLAGRAVAGGVALALVVSGGAVGAERVLHARTGEVATDPEDIAIGGPGELLRTDADDFVAVARGFVTDIPFAPGYERHRDAALEEMYDPTHGPSGISTGALRLSVATTAFCTWVASWMEARTVGDRVGQQRAADVLAGSTRWPAVTDVDPDPDPSGATENEGRRTWTPFGWAVPVIEAVQADDPARTVAVLTRDGSESPCTTFPLPFVPDREPNGPGTR